MEKFNRVAHGYDPNEVNAFLDKIIMQVESMVNDIKVKNDRIAQLEQMEKDYRVLKEKNDQFIRMEDTLRQAIFMAEKTSEQIKLSAHQEREIITNDAKRNASRIINEALLRAERIDSDAEAVRRNTVVLKRRLRDILETQLQMVDEIEKIEI